VGWKCRLTYARTYPSPSRRGTYQCACTLSPQPSSPSPPRGPPPPLLSPSPSPSPPLPYLHPTISISRPSHSRLPCRPASNERTNVDAVCTMHPRYSRSRALEARFLDGPERRWITDGLAGIGWSSLGRKREEWGDARRTLRVS